MLRTHPARMVGLIAALAMPSIGPTAYATTLTWDANGTGAGTTDGSGSWTGANLWYDGAANATWTSGDDAIIGANNGAGGTITVPTGGVTVNSITFNPPSSGRYILSGQPITLSGSGDVITNHGGPLYGSASLITSVVAGVRLIKSGADLLYLEGTNSFSGLTVNAGEVAFFNSVAATGNSQLGSGDIVLGNNTSLIASTTGSPTVARAIDFKGSATLQYTAGTSGTLGINGALTNSSGNPINVTLRVDDAARVMSMGGTIADSNTSLVKEGPGYVYISTVNKTYGGSTTINEGKIRLNGKTLPSTTDLYIAASGTFDLWGTAGGQTVASLNDVSGVGGTVDNSFTNAQTLTVGSGTFSGLITQTGTGASATALTKNTAGTLNLTRATGNTYSGATTISNGTLRVNNTSGSGTGTGNVSVSGGATLGGSGIISGAVTVASAGTLAPGNSPGSLELGSTLNLQAGSNLVIEISGTSFTLNTTEQYDRVKATGLTTLAGTLSASLTSYSLAGGELFGIVDAVGGLSGVFSNYAENDVVLTNSGHSLRITYLGSITDSTVSQTGGNDVVLFSETIPEPASLALLALGGLMMASRRLTR